MLQEFILDEEGFIVKAKLTNGIEISVGQSGKFTKDQLIHRVDDVWEVFRVLSGYERTESDSGYVWDWDSKEDGRSVLHNGEEITCYDGKYIRGNAFKDPANRYPFLF